MRQIRRFFNRHQVMIPFIVIGLVVVVGFASIEARAKEAKDQICKAELEDRILIKDILDFVSDNASGSESFDPSTLPPELQELIEQNQASAQAFSTFANERLNIPPDVCKGTGITAEDVREDLASN